LLGFEVLHYTVLTHLLCLQNDVSNQAKLAGGQSANGLQNRGFLKPDEFDGSASLGRRQSMERRWRSTLPELVYEAVAKKGSSATKPSFGRSRIKPQPPNSICPEGYREENRGILPKVSDVEPKQSLTASVRGPRHQSRCSLEQPERKVARGPASQPIVQ
jgi:hypothetical protein